MITKVLIAALAALVGLVPGYFIGKTIRGRKNVYLAIFWAEIAFMVPIVAWALWAGYPEIAAAALGFSFGVINGLRHGFSPVFGPLVDAAKQAEEQRR
jgi:hypothetical protein